MIDHPAQETDVARDARFSEEALRWLPEITRFARMLAGGKSDGDDLVQETFLRAYRFWSSYMPGTDCRRWLVTICRNVYRSRVARESVVQSVGDDAALDTIATVHARQRARDGGVDHLFERLELGVAIHDAIGMLSEPYRVVVQLVDVDGMAYDDVAAALDIPVGTVRSRLFRARRMLQETLIEHARDAGFSTARAGDQGPTSANDSRSSTE
jgi:RNA polymerase sigma-70 factor (ECF subfamily)